MEHQINFNNWLLGFTEGDGCFSINKQDRSWSICYKLTQSTYNTQILYFIKQRLGCGYITYEIDKQLINFRIRDLNSIGSILLPIFDSVHFMTVREWDYIRFRKIYMILIDSTISIEDRDILISDLLKIKRPATFLPTVYKTLGNSIESFNENIISDNFVKTILNNFWIIGFVEADGSFFIVKKELNRYSHAFGITQKYDRIVLLCLSKFFHFPNRLGFNKQGFYFLETTNSRVIENISKFFYGKFKGRKSLEFKIWIRSQKYRHNSETMEKYQLFLRRIRAYRSIIKNDEGIVPTTM